MECIPRARNRRPCRLLPNMPARQSSSTMRSLRLLVALALLACSGRSRRDTLAAPAEAGRAPAQHRPSGVTCPSVRGAGISSAPCSGVGECSSDTECAAGVQGRCINDPAFSCATWCSYDECSSDTSCDNRHVCLCRTSAQDNAPNLCTQQGDCVVDTDCGADGYCSPSELPTGSGIQTFDPNQPVECDCMVSSLCDGGLCCRQHFGRGYFCHDARDECLDDGDCPSGARCSFDLTSQHFACRTC
jgi:hypothetical protein